MGKNLCSLINSNTVQNINFGGFSIAMGLEYVKLRYGRETIPYITEHIGDYSAVFASILLLDGLVSNINAEDSYGQTIPAKKFIKDYSLELVTGLTTFYFTLAETVVPELLLSTADIKDLPTVFCAAVSAYILSKDNTFPFIK